MVAQRQTPRLHSADLDDFPDDGMRYELLDGELYVSGAQSKRHQRLSGRLLRLIDDHVAPDDLGEVFFAPVDVWLSDGDRTQPDLVYLSAARLSIYGERMVEGAPDLLVEIASPSTRMVDLVAKRNRFEHNDVREYWIADPDSKTLTILCLTDGRYVEHHRSLVLPGLTIDVPALMANLE